MPSAESLLWSERDCEIRGASFTASDAHNLVFGRKMMSFVMLPSYRHEVGDDDLTGLNLERSFENVRRSNIPATGGVGTVGSDGPGASTLLI
jgi:hypothetical protein